MNILSNQDRWTNFGKYNPISYRGWPVLIQVYDLQELINEIMTTPGVASWFSSFVCVGFNDINQISVFLKARALWNEPNLQPSN